MVNVLELNEDYFLEITPGDYSLDFELKEKIIENGKDTTRAKIKGFLKWDGCMNWKTVDSCMYHFCEENDATILNDAFKKLWEVGNLYIKHWLD